MIRITKKLLCFLIVAFAMISLTIPVAAATMTDASVVLSNLKPSAISSYHFTMKLGTTHNVKAIRMDWKTIAIGGTTPAWLEIFGSSLFDINSGDVGDWTLNNSNFATGITLKNAAGAEIAENEVLEWTIDNIINPIITQYGNVRPGCTSYNAAGNGNGDMRSGKAFILVQTYNSTDMLPVNIVDEVTIPFIVTTNEDLGDFIVTQVVTKPSGATIYLQKENKPCADVINFWTGPYQPAIGDKINVYGTKSGWDSWHSIQMSSGVVTLKSQANDLPKPTAFNNRAIFSSLNDKGAPCYALRAKVWGKVRKPSSFSVVEFIDGYYAAYIEDGSKIIWPAATPAIPHRGGIKLMTSSLETLNAINNSEFYLAQGVIDTEYHGKRYPVIWLDN